MYNTCTLYAHVLQYMYIVCTCTAIHVHCMHMYCNTCIYIVCTLCTCTAIDVLYIVCTCTYTSTSPIGSASTGSGRCVLRCFLLPRPSSCRARPKSPLATTPLSVSSLVPGPLPLPISPPPSLTLSVSIITAVVETCKMCTLKTYMHTYTSANSRS